MNSVVVQVPAVEIFGVRVHAATMAQALDIIDGAIASRQSLQVGVVNAAKVVNMGRDPMLRDDVLASDLILADGIAVVWAGKLLGAHLPERVTGIDLMNGMLERANSKGYRFYLLGASEEVSAKVAERIGALYPGAVVAGRRNGYYKDADEQQIADEIARSRADVLLVAITSPKKEKFMARWGQTMGVPVCHGVGGSFDVMAGKVERAPESWQRLGLEWLYRLKQEPGRLWKRYLVTNATFCWLLLRAFVQRLGNRSTARPLGDP